MATSKHRRSAAYVALVFLAAWSTGCAVQTLEHDTRYMEDDFTLADLASDRVAVGGVVLAPDVPVDACADLPSGDFPANHLAQADQWSAALEAELHQAGIGEVVWGWPVVRTFLSERDLAALLGNYAADGRLDGGILVRLAAELPDVDILCLARVDGNRLERMGQFNQAPVAFRFADPAGAWDRIDLVPSPRGDPNVAVATGHDKYRPRGIVGRTVRLTLDFYDLRAGRSVATVNVSVNLDTTRWQQPPGDREAVLVRSPSPASPLVQVAGTTSYAPPLCETISACLGNIVTGPDR